MRLAEALMALEREGMIDRWWMPGMLLTQFNVSIGELWEHRLEERWVPGPDPRGDFDLEDWPTVGGLIALFQEAAGDSTAHVTYTSGMWVARRGAVDPTGNSQQDTGPAFTGATPGEALKLALLWYARQACL